MDSMTIFPRVPDRPSIYSHIFIFHYLNNKVFHSEGWFDSFVVLNNEKNWIRKLKSHFKWLF